MSTDELKFVPCMNIDLVPRHLFEQAPYTPEQVDRIYELGKAFITSPLTVFYVLTDPDHHIQGVLWASIDPITGDIYVKLLSVARKYQSPKSQLIHKALSFLRSLPFGPRVTGHILFQTKKPRAYERAGATKSNYILMQFVQETNDEHNEDTVQEPDISGPRLAV